MYPKVIYFCNKTIESMVRPVNNWKILNPQYEIRLFDDEMCEIFLLNEFGKLHRDIFRYIPDGPIKADFWRICILYKNGGVYSDIDIEPFVPIDDFIEQGIYFATCSSFWDKKKFDFNPNFIVSSKHNPELEKCIQWYVDKYIQKHEYSYWGWSIMQVFTDIFHLSNYAKKWGVYTLENNTNARIQIIQECRGITHHDAHNIYNNKRVFNNRYKNWNHNKHAFADS